jgi:hypothetical protein
MDTTGEAHSLLYVPFTPPPDPTPLALLNPIFGILLHLQPRGSNTTRYGKGPVGTGVVSSVAGGGIVGPNGMITPSNHVFSPEYDDPANIDEEYGYGSPRRGSAGRRSVGKSL